MLLFPLRREAILIESTLEVWIELIDSRYQKLTADDPAKRMTYRRATNGGVLRQHTGGAKLILALYALTVATSGSEETRGTADGTVAQVGHRLQG